MSAISRRDFNKIIVASGLSFMIPSLGGVMAADRQKRFLLVILRGALDGLAAVPPFGDTNYEKARAGLALPNNAILPLDDFFGLHHSLESLYQLFKQKELAVFHAIASPYRKRSHFEAQDIIENGMSSPASTSSGWLNRAVESLVGNAEIQASALAVGGNVPIVLQGKAAVNSWSPDVLPEPHDEFMNRVSYMYQSDPLLHSLLEQSKEMDMIAMTGDNQKKNRNFTNLIQTAGNFMAEEKGPMIGVVELGGWDTHANQGLENGILSNKLKEFARGIQAYKGAMGNRWKDTVVLAVTEFGRTVKMNGTRGSDHGTASVAFVAGGNMNGGMVRGKWPGLAVQNLYQERDLYPTSDLRALMKTIMHQHLNISKSKLDSYIFPDSQNVGYFKQLLG